MASVIFNGNYVKALKSLLNLNDTAYVLTGTADPTSSAQDAPQGSIYMRTGSNGGRIYKKLDSGSSTNWRDISSSFSGMNYILNPDADASVENWSAYADAAGTSPVDGTGGSPTVTITRTTSSPLEGLGSFLLTKDAANRQGEGVSTAFSISSADKSKAMLVDFYYEVPSGTFVSGDSSDLRVFIYDVTNGVLIQPYGHTLRGHGSSSQRYQGLFQTASNSTSYRLIIHVATTSASAYTVKFDRVKVTSLENNLPESVGARISGITAATAWPASSVVTFTTTDVDTHGMVSGLNKITVAQTGIYNVYAQLSTTNAVGTGTGKDLDLFVKKNGTEILADFWTNEVSGSSAFVVLGVDGILKLNAGDYIEVFASRDTDMAATFQTASSRCFLEVVKLAH